jgi:fluoride ion exporter CrcB/FEX
LIEPRLSYFDRFSKVIRAVLVANILASYAESVTTWLDTFFALVTPRYREFEDEALFGGLMGAAAKLSTFFVAKDRLFFAQLFVFQKQLLSCPNTHPAGSLQSCMKKV